MIHITIGTKAQFIKMAPIMLNLKAKDINFNLIDLGQHALTTQNLRKEFGIKEPDVCLSSGKNVTGLLQGIIWIFKLLTKVLRKEWIKQNVFLNRRGVCLVHGDTISTIVAALFAKRAGLKVAHIEAGLRSYSIFEPFPEEIIRILVMKLSDHLFAPSSWAYNNLKAKRLEKKSIQISANTSLETALYSLEKKEKIPNLPDKYALVTVHRMENIMSKKRMAYFIELITKVSKRIPIVFVQHPPTIQQLNKYGLSRPLKKNINISLFKIVTHAQFISLMNSSEFVITDGGSVQEESFYLKKPCLLLRKKTERLEGINENVVINGLSLKEADHFLNHYHDYKCQTQIDFKLKPAEEIIHYLSGYLEEYPVRSEI